MNTQELTTALTEAAPFLQELTSAGLTKTLDSSNPDQARLKGALKEFGTDLVSSGILKRQDNKDQPFAVHPESLADFVAKNETMDASKLVLSMGKAMTEIARQEPTVMALLPDGRRDGFVESYHTAARAAYTMGSSLDVHAVTGFGREAIGSASPLMDERRAESVASDASLDTVRRSLLNVVEGMHASGATFSSDTMGRSMRAMVDNAKESLGQAGYVLPGQTEARTQPFSEQSARGSRQDAETIAGSARMLSEAFATPGAMESIQFPENRAMGGLQGMKIHAKGLEQAVDGVETSAAEIRALRGAYNMSPEQAGIAIDLLIASANVTGQARLGMNTEMTFEEGRGGMNGAMVRVARSDSTSVKPRMERVFGVDSEPPDETASKRKGAGREGGLDGEILSFSRLTDDAPMTEAVGTVLVPAKAMMNLQDAYKRAKEVDLVGAIDDGIPTFQAAREAEQASVLGRGRVQQAENAVVSLDAGAEAGTKRTAMSEQEFARKDLATAEQAAQETRREQDRVPFGNEKQAKHFADMIDAVGSVVESRGFKGSQDVVVTDSAMQGLTGHTDYLLNNMGYHRLAMLAGRSIAEVEKVADSREPALYATQEEASKAMQPEQAWEKPDAALRRMHVAEPEMSRSDWNAYVDRQGASSPQMLALRNKVVYFDPTMAPGERSEVPEGLKGRHIVHVHRGLVDMEATSSTPPSLEDQVHNRSDLHRALMARMTRPDGTPNIGFRDELIRLQPEHTPVLVSDNVRDARILRSAALGAQKMFEDSVKAQDERWASDPKVPKGTITMDAKEVKAFVDQVRQGGSTDTPVLAVRSSKVVLEHPEGATVSGQEKGMEQAKAWRAPGPRETNQEVGAPMTGSRAPGVVKFSSPKMDLDELEKISAGARDSITFKVAGTRVLDVVADVPRARSKDTAERD